MSEIWEEMKAGLASRALQCYPPNADGSIYCHATQDGRPFYPVHLEVERNGGEIEVALEVREDCGFRSKTFPEDNVVELHFGTRESFRSARSALAYIDELLPRMIALRNEIGDGCECETDASRS